MKNYTDEFKKQIVSLDGNGKTIVELAKEYGIARSTIRKLVNDYKSTGSFKASDNRSDEENEFLTICKLLKIFNESENNYGSKKIKEKFTMIASRRKIRNIMKKYNLVSSYTVVHFKIHKGNYNIANIVEKI